MQLFRRLMLGLLTAVWLVACAPVPGGSGEEPVIPILANDPDDLVDSMEWGRSSILDEVPDPEPTDLEVLDGSTPTVARVAIVGGGCRPTVQAQITGPPESATIELVVGGAIVPEGFECREEATTHELIITFNEPIELDGLTVSVRRTAPS